MQNEGEIRTLLDCLGEPMEILVPVVLVALTLAPLVATVYLDRRMRKRSAAA